MKKMLMVIKILAAAAAFADAEADSVAAGEVSYFEAGQSVTNIRAYAFAECRKLETFRADFALSLGRNALMGCTTLREVSLPAVTNVVYATMFSGCVRLENVHLPQIGIEEAKASGFPWSTPARNVVFHFADGDYDRTGRKID